MGVLEQAADKGAAALVKGGVVCDPVTGDVLHDHDWTPIEAARAVLEAVDYAGAVDEMDEVRAAARELRRACIAANSPTVPADVAAAVSAITTRWGQ